MKPFVSGKNLNNSIRVNNNFPEPSYGKRKVQGRNGKALVLVKVVPYLQNCGFYAMDTKTSRFQNTEKINVEVERPKPITEFASIAERPKWMAENSSG